MKPMLWRLRACRAPGLPSPAMTSMGSPIGQPEPLVPRGAEAPAPASGRASVDALGRYFLAAGLAAAGLAAAGAAAAPFAGAAAPLPAAAAGAAPAAGAAAAPAAGAAAAPAGGVSSTMTVGGTIVTTVSSAVPASGRQPSGSLSADTCTESWKSMPARSMVMDSGM